jgi:hypothetical protein
MARRLNGSQATTYVLCQQNPQGRSNTVPIGAEFVLRSSHDDQEAKPLLLGTHSPSHVRSAIGTCPPKQRSNRVDRSMGSGDRPV